MNILPQDHGNASKISPHKIINDYRLSVCRLSLHILMAGILLFSSVCAHAEKILSAQETLNVDPTTGTANLNIPIEVPPGRGGIQPNVNLFYNSGSPNGKLGVGWVLELGNIRRSTKRGVPKYNSTDSYILTQAGSAQELIYDPATGTYQPKIEGAFMKIEKYGDIWIATDKQGIKYYFGRKSASRQDDPINSARIFQWCLDRVEDLHGNYMMISYSKDQGQIYEDMIEYTGSSQGILPFASVKFIYDTARTDVSARYNAAFKVVTARRLSAVEVRGGGDLLRKYRFSYVYDSETKTSLLNSATQFASDGATSLPTTTFTYSEGNTNLTTTRAVTNHPPDNLINSSLTRFIDINADGYTDMIRSPSRGWHYRIFINNKNWDFNSYTETTNEPPMEMNADIEVADLNGDAYPDILYGQTNNYQVWINNKSNNFNLPVGSASSPDVPLNNANIIVLDINSDGFPDLVRSYPGNYLIFLNNVSGQFQSPVSATNPPPQDLGSGNVRFADFNGDGLVDIIHGTSSTYKLHINNGNSGFEPAVTLSDLNLTGLAVSSPYVGLADMNGDGLTDIVRSGDGSQPYYIYFNEGDLSFSSQVTAVNPPVKGLNQAKWMDMNADGLLDIVIGQNAESVKTISLNNGINGFHPSSGISSFPNADLDDGGNMLVDLNADGLPDLLRGVNSEGYRTYENPSAQAATSRTCILTKSDNGMGVTTDITYENIPITPLAGTQYKLAVSPTLFNTVKRTVRKIGSNESYATDYESKNGRWNFKNREFRGFEEVKVTDPDGNYTRTIFHQDDIFKGRVKEQMSYDVAGTMLAKAVNAWDQEALLSGAKFAFLKRVDHFSYDGNPQGRCRGEEYFYEEAQQRGNLTKVVQLGDVSVIGDERSVETVYVNNDSDHIIGLPSEVISKDHKGNVRHKTWFDYDGQGNGSAPTAGLLTRKKDWAGDAPGAVHPVATYSYDVYGNLSLTGDPKNNLTTISYDNSHEMFPVTTQNAMNHAVDNVYYGVNNVPMDNGLWGQIKSTTDPNSRQGSRTYDVFGRLNASVSPLDSTSFPTNTAGYEINQGGQFYKVTASQRKVNGQSGMIEQKQFYDGAGRLMQSKTVSGTPGQFIVRGQVEYNARGLPFKQYLPYFTTVALDTPNAIDPAKPYATTQYDSLGRVTKTTNPDGTFSTVEYGDMVTTTINENGHQQKSYFDVYGRLIRKEEYTGADGRSPHYLSSLYTLYAATGYKYDPEGNLTKVIDAHGNITTITYDKLGRKIAMNDPDMGIWTYKYDLNGNLTEQTDAKGQTIYFAYDTLNRLVNKTDGGALNVDYTYDDPFVTDAKGRLTKAQYGLEETQFAYDPIGREIESIKKINNANYGVQRNYDALNNLLDITYPDNTKIFYKYNPAGQIEAISNDASLIGPQSFLWEKEMGDQKGISQWAKYDVGADQRVRLEMAKMSLWENFQLNVANFYTDWFEPNILGIKEAQAATIELVTLEAENMPTKTTGGSTSGGWNIWSNGYIQGTVSFPNTAIYEFEIVAKGSYANGAWPNMELRIDQTKVWNTTVNIGSWMSFITEVSVAAGSHNVAAAFTNDYYNPGVEDRNLYVDKIIIREIVSSQPSPSPSGSVFTQDTGIDGIVSMEAEHYAANTAQGSHQWDPVSQAGESGTGSLQSLPNTGTNNNTGYVTNSPRLDYTVNFTKTGTHYVWVRGIGLSGSDDSCHAGLDRQASTSSDRISSFNTSWKWSKSTMDGTAATINVPTTGEHTFNIWMREDGFIIDKIVLTTSSSYAPTGLGPDETVSTESTPLLVPVLNAPVAGDGQVDLTWSAVTGATGYKVKYGIVSGVYGAPVDVGNVTSYTVPALTNGTAYYFIVTAYDATQESAYSNEQSAAPVAPPPPPPPPGALTAPVLSPITAGDTQAQLTWSNIDGATGYKVKYGTTSGGGVSSGADFTQDPSCKAAWKLDEASGALIDSCGVNTGTVSGNVAQGSAGQYDNAVEFYGAYGSPDGNNAHVNMGSDASLDNLGARTLTAWIHPHTLGNSNRGTILYKNYQDGWEFRLSENNNLAFSQAFTGGVVTWKTTANAVQLNTWQHVAVTYAGSDKYDIPVIYINGVEQAISGWTPYGTIEHAAWQDVLMGIHGGVYEFDGLIDEVAIFSRMLAVAEIQEVMSNGLSGGTATAYEFEVDAANVTSYTVSGLTNGTPYYFVVEAYNALETGPMSNEESVTPAVQVLAPVLNTATAGDGQVALNWSAVAGINGYKVHYGTVAGVYTAMINTGNVTGYTVAELMNDTTYYFAVTAYDATGESALSNEVNAMPLPAPAVDDPQLFVKNVEYNVHGQVTKIEYGNGVVTTNSYNPLNFRLTRIYTVDAQSAVIQDLNYGYDSIGNVLSIKDNINIAKQTFRYDEQNRLVQASSPLQTYGTKTYAYDEIGNIKEKDGRFYYYQENGAGPHAVSSLSDGTAFTYDANGNMLMKQGPDLVTAGYQYDPENRLVKVTRAGVLIAEYEYDGDGGRTAKTAYDPSNAQGTCFLAGTPVLMADGTLKLIEEMQVGDVVVSLDEQTGDQVISNVTETFKEFTQDYLVINGALRVTENHPFYREGQWQEAGTLKKGDKLLSLSLNDAEIKTIKKMHSPKPIKVYNMEVNKYHNYFVTRGRSDVDGYLVHNKFPGPTANAVFQGTTHYVGSLFEINNVQSTKYIYLGGTRVASITNGKTMYYHGDHLGGTNVLTDIDGALKELIEYEPFGAYARHEKYGLADEVAHFYFTGQRTDDESGLMYYGARYYDPTVGRFLTPDTIVPYPTNLQTLNRYSYAGNNPVSNLEDGHGFWKSLWKGIKTVVKAFFNFQIPGAGSAITGGSFSEFNQQAANIGAAALFSWGNPVVIASSFISFNILNTKAGKGAIKFVADEIYDDFLGFSPSTAYTLAGIDLSITSSFLAERTISSMLNDPVKVQNNLSNAELEKVSKGDYSSDESIFGPSLKTKGAFEKSQIKGLVGENELKGSFQRRTLDLPFFKQIGAQHSSANVLNISSGLKMNPQTYAICGVCHQATNLTLLNGGISSTILDINPSWDMYVTTAVYGNYGGQLGNRILSGINANQNYEEGSR